MAREDLHFRLRIPEGIKAKVERAAEDNRRSMTAEIVKRLEASFADPMMPDPPLPGGLFWPDEDHGIDAQRSPDAIRHQIALRLQSIVANSVEIAKLTGSMSSDGEVSVDWSVVTGLLLAINEAVYAMPAIPKRKR